MNAIKSNVTCDICGWSTAVNIVSWVDALVVSNHMASSHPQIKTPELRDHLTISGVSA